MKKEHFDELIKSVNQASKIMHGKMKPSRIFHIEPSDVQSIREQYRLSQTKFAKMLGISPSTLRNWERGRRESLLEQQKSYFRLQKNTLKQY